MIGVYLLEFKDNQYMIVKASDISFAKVAGRVYSSDEPKKISCLYEHQSADCDTTSIIINRMGKKGVLIPD